MKKPLSYALSALLLCLTAGAEEKLDYNRDVRPILSDKCFLCHGPDAKNQKSDFRIDSFENATADLGDYFGVVPGKLKESEVHWRLHTDDPTELMPPPEKKIPLTKEEIAILDRWIEEGAEYQEHWSFVPVREEIPVPETGSDWPNGPIDQFILSRLQKENFAPSPETSREKWLRRVTFDLTGLPPTIAEIDAFLADTTDDAFAKVVDRLLDTDAAAERLAAEWLDVARYSDTYGYQVDRDRTVWQWRDWVIRAFRENLPYDDFITWQLAGDLLPNATRDQKLATAFNRLHGQKVEGGSVPEEFRIEYVSDRVHTYGTAFLGLTMECSRCHDHKYDPITAEDYFSLSSYFDNIDEAGLYSYFTPAVPTPTLWLPTEEQEKQLAGLEKEIADAEAKLNTLAKDALPAYEKWKTESGGKAPVPTPIASFTFEDNKGNKLANGIDKEKPATTTANNSLVAGKFGKAIKLSGDDAVTLPVGNFTRDDPFSVSLWMQTPEKKERAVIYSRSKAWTDAASRGYELLLEDGKLSAAFIHFYPGNAIRVRAKQEVPVGSWHHVAVTYDGSSRADGVTIFLDGKALELETVRDKLTREITGGGSDTIVIGQRMRDNGFKGGLVDDFRVFDLALSAPAVAAIANGDKDYSPLPTDPVWSETQPYQVAHATLFDLRKKRSELVKKIPEIMTMREEAEPHQTYILDRGHYANRGEPVESKTPGFLPPPAEGTPANRLGLARWTTASNNPLTARVTVNRYWQMLFGTGLVSTSEDLGSQGRSPTHPELLDWLARDFMDSGWNLHRLLKQIVLSATYRQSSDITSGELVTRDPENTLLYRFPAPRLPAEMIRDNLLASSGLLVAKLGGPSVKPYDLAVSFKPTDPGKGADLYRRSLYTYWRQTGPAPMMTTLNASKRDVCRVNLEKTDSPLQGLVLLNSPQAAEAARTLAAKLVQKHGDNKNAILEDAFRRLTSRKPDETEKEILTKLLQEQEEIFETKPEAAKQLLAAGDSAEPKTENPAGTAAVATLVSTLMNFDECITKR
ncbi:MAG: DUF1553 domain-containing protein [Verrucomicrobiales bacterium]|nr:DUF1553 domain-containing protein [Verrucomicrobiales bacterium]